MWLCPLDMRNVGRGWQGRCEDGKGGEGEGGQSTPHDGDDHDRRSSGLPRRRERSYRGGHPAGCRFSPQKHHCEASDRSAPMTPRPTGTHPTGHLARQARPTTAPHSSRHPHAPHPLPYLREMDGAPIIRSATDSNAPGSTSDPDDQDSWAALTYVPRGQMLLVCTPTFRLPPGTCLSGWTYVSQDACQ